MKLLAILCLIFSASKFLPFTLIYFKCSFFYFLQHCFVPHISGSAQGTIYTGRELEYAFFVHSLCLLGKVLIYTHGRRLFPIQAVKHKGKKKRKSKTAVTKV